MTQRLASDPAGQAFVFELLIRTFFVCVLGVREECVGWRRGESKTVRKAWCTDGVAHEQMASTIFGWVQAAFGPIEAQGRGSLHPHILLWLVDITAEEAVEILSRDPETFKANLQQWMVQILAAVAATQETSVTELPRTWASDEQMQTQPAPLPLGPNEKECYRADGAAEHTTEADVERAGVSEAAAKLYFTVPGATAAEDEWPEAVRANLVLRTHGGQEVDDLETSVRRGTEKYLDAVHQRHCSWKKAGLLHTAGVSQHAQFESSGRRGTRGRIALRCVLAGGLP